MNHTTEQIVTTKHAVLAAALMAALPLVSTRAFAGSADSTGGIKVKSDDGRFEATLGGLLNVDGIAFDKDKVRTGYGEGLYLRRAEIALSGKVYDFKYKLQTDLKGSSSESKDMWIGTDALGGFIKAGHMRPAYGMQLLTASADLVFTERPYVGNAALFAGREFQNGVSYDTHMIEGFTAMVTGYNANSSADKSASAAQPAGANGVGYAARVTWAPVMSDAMVLHLGASYDSATWESGTAANAPAIAAPVVSRNAPTLTLESAGSYDRQRTPIGELALRAGRFYLGAEYAPATFRLNTGASEKVTAYYVESSVFVTGESRPYKADKGVFGGPKPAHVEYGALELKARYDTVENRDAATAPKATITTLGANYYFNPAVRVMLEYSMGHAETVAAQDKPNALVMRGQVAF